MARRSRLSVLKRQRELKKSEKAARKRSRRHGVPIAPGVEPRATYSLSPSDGEPTEDGLETDDTMSPDENEETVDAAKTTEPASQPPPAEPI